MLVSNMQISRFNLIIYNLCNLSASSTLISCYAIIFSRFLTCSICFRLYSCRSPTCCSLGALYGFTLGTYDYTEIGSPEGSTVVLFVVGIFGVVLFHDNFSTFFFSSLKRCCNALGCSINMSRSSIIYITSTSLFYSV